MCGIAGILRFDGAPVDCTDIKTMTHAIAHRGPDGEGQWCEGSIGLGHRRLAIIDLSEAAAQPMHSRDGRYVISYNGEVYNFRELRRELEKQGSRFFSQSDTEVVLEAVIRWGIDGAIRRFNGMFAFVIWDSHEREMILGRDRYGIKPLYLWQTRDLVAFASEPKAFRALSKFDARVDPVAVAEYFTFQNIISNRTFLIGVSVFPSGHYAIIRVGSNEPAAVHLHQYWDFSFMEPNAPATEEEYVEEAMRLIAQAVERQLVSDVEVGAYLSGGLDSGALVAMATQVRPCLKTFTIGFDLTAVDPSEMTFDERDRARDVARALGTTHVDSIVSPGDVRASIPMLAWHMEEPRVGQSYPNLHAAALARKFAKVVLSGTGGDEIFGGYPWRYQTGVTDFDALRRASFQVWNRGLSSDKVVQLLKPSGSSLQEADLREMHAETLSRGWRDGGSEYASLNAALYYEAKTFLPGLLAVEDRLSMAFGIEVRVPFLDNDLVDFAQNIPGFFRLGRGENASRTERSGKSLLRRAMQGVLPDPVVVAAKQGFAGPDSRWFREDLSALIDYAAGNLPDDLLDPQVVGAALKASKSNGPKARTLGWSLLASGMYFNVFQDSGS